MTTVINLFGGPGLGKSTLAAGLFHHMKCKGHDVEIVTEYAKDMVWENRYNIMDDQLYVFAKQYRRISRLRDQVEFVIVDSPILMCCAYINDGYFNNLEPLAVEAFNSFNNINFLLTRTNVEYDDVGRVQNFEEAVGKDVKIKNLLETYQAGYAPIQPRSPDAIEDIYSQIA